MGLNLEVVRIQQYTNSGLSKLGPGGPVPAGFNFNPN